MKKSLLFGITAMGMAVVAAPMAFATPTLTISVGINSVNTTVTDLSLYLGSGTYGVAPGTLGGFSWAGILLHTNGTDQFTIDPTTISNGNSGNTNAIITLTATDTVSDPTAQSMQASGGTTATGATSNQTVDFTSEVYSSTPSALLGTQDSGPLGLNSHSSPTNPSSSIPYNSSGIDLAGTITSNLTLIDQMQLSINPATTLTAGSFTTNLLDTTIPTPEPATLALFALGGLALLAGARRRRNRA